MAINRSSNRVKKLSVKQQIEMRVKVLYTISLLVAVVFVVRIFCIQFGSREIAFNANRIKARIYRYETVVAHRGSILTRNGEPLANSINKHQVEMDFGCEGFDRENKYRENSDSLAILLSAYFGDRTAAQYKKLFREERAKRFRLVNGRDTIFKRQEGIVGWFLERFDANDVTIPIFDTLRNHDPVSIFPRKVDLAEWEILKRYPILNWNMGMSYQLVSEESRVYAFDGVARRTIGAINSDKDRGQDYGIEAVYNKWLKGQDGKLKQQRIARGFYATVPDAGNREPVEGLDVVTTIDADIQDIAHSALRKRLMETNARWGTTVVMEVATGDILAIVNLDRIGSGANRQYEEQQNRALGARSEPGSTMKLATAMALIEVGNMPTTKVYNSEDGRRVKVGSITVQDSHKGHSEVALDVAFSQSLNVYFAKAVYEHFKDDPKVFTDYLKNRLRLNKRVGFAEFGEREPILYDPDDRGKGWYPHSTLVSMATGYAMEFTPLQVLTFYNGFANEGRIVAPRLVSEIRDSSGAVQERFGVRTLEEQMCSRPTLDSLKRYMVEVNRSGTGAWWLGRFQGFEVAAKTGTAQFAQDGLSHRDGFYVSSMVGFMPANRPKYSVITTVHLSRSETTGGSYYGSTMAGEVMQSVMQQLFNKELKWHAQLDTIAPLHRIDSTQVIRSLDMSSVDVDILDDSYTSTVEIPYIYGLGLRDAIFLLESVGLRVKIVGNGAVFRQSHRAGTKVKRGTTVEITLK